MRTVPWALSVAAAVAAAADRDDEKREPCFSMSLPEARAVAISRDGKYAGAGALESFHVLMGGLAPTGFMKFGFRPVHMAPHPDRPQFAVAAGNVHVVEMAARKSVAELKPASWFVAWRRGGAGYGFDFLDADTGERLARATLTGHDSVESWDMAFADSEEPTILFLANETVYLCPWSGP